jgi:hypothetical protein
VVGEAADDGEKRLVPHVSGGQLNPCNRPMTDAGSRSEIGLAPTEDGPAGSNLPSDDPGTVLGGVVIDAANDINYDIR